MYRITIPKLERTYVSNSLKIGLVGALSLLNRNNGKVNFIKNFSDKDIVGTLLENDQVAMYTQFGDMICVERIRVEVSANGKRL